MRKKMKKTSFLVLFFLLSLSLIFSLQSQTLLQQKFSPKRTLMDVSNLPFIIKTSNLGEYWSSKAFFLKKIQRIPFLFLPVLGTIHLLKLMETPNLLWSHNNLAGAVMVHLQLLM